MAERVPAGKAQKDWKALLDRAQKGERIVITRDGKDVATLGPVAQQDVTVRVDGVPPAKTWAGARYDTPGVRDILSKVNTSKKGNR